MLSGVVLELLQPGIFILFYRITNQRRDLDLRLFLLQLEIVKLIFILQKLRKSLKSRKEIEDLEILKILVL